MSDAIERPMDGETAHSVEPPIVDFCYFDSDRQCYVITFVPEERISRNQKETVLIAASSEDGRRVEVRIAALSRLMGIQIHRVFHAGGEDFGFYATDGRELHLADSSAAVALNAYVQLQDIGMISQIAFREEQLVKASP